MGSVAVNIPIAVEMVDIVPVMTPLIPIGYTFPFPAQAVKAVPGDAAIVMALVPTVDAGSSQHQAETW